MATATKQAKLTKRQRDFLASSSAGRYSLPQGQYPDYVLDLMKKGILSYEGVWASAHHWKTMVRTVLEYKGERHEMRTMGGDLKRPRRQVTIQDSKKTGNPEMTPRPRRTRDLKTYSARVSHALEQARVKRGWAVDDLQKAINAAGGPEVPISTLYAYELGKANKGVDVPMNLFPAIAKALGYKSAAGWLPAE